MLVGMPMPGNRSIARLVAAIATALLLGTAAVTTAGATTSAAKRPTVTIKNFAFSPKTLRVKAGATVKVKNADGTTHTFTANKGAFDTGDIDGGSSATVTVKKPGTYAYHCNIHSSMKGTITAT